MNSVGNKGAKRYIIVVVIIIVMLIMGPEIAVAVFFGTIGFAGVEVNNWRLVMHLIGIAFLIVMAIVYYFSRGKHAAKQTPPRREGHVIAAVIIAVVTTYAIGVNYVMGTYPPIVMHLGVFVLLAILSGLIIFSYYVMGIYPPRFMRRGVFVLLAILLGLITCTYFIVWYNAGGRYQCIGGFDRLQILYVAANQTSREIYCKVLNTGSHLLTLEEVRVNGSKVITSEQLPITIKPVCVLDYKTFVFRYDGPWKGSILLDFLAAGRDWEKLVDLQTASSNPIEGAYPDKFELLSIYINRNLGEIARYMEAVLWGSIAAYLAVGAQLVLRGLKKKELRIKYMLIIMLLASPLVPYRLHTIKRPLVTFSEDGDIVGDGGGPYVDGVAGMRIYVYDAAAYPSNCFGLNGYDSPRFVYVRLGDVPWRDENLRDMPPRLPSKNWIVELDITIRNGTIPKIGVGERLEPDSIYLLFWDPYSTNWTDMLRDLTYYRPPSELYKEGHAYLIGEGGDTWVLDVDAWFMNADWASNDVNTPKYWVRLNFRMTIDMKSLI